MADALGIVRVRTICRRPARQQLVRTRMIF